MSFANLKRNRSKVSDLVEAAQKASGGSKYDDDRFWKLSIDKAKNGYAIIRFLEGTSEDKVPWVQYWDHWFKGPSGKYYIEKSLTSLGEDDPVGEVNGKLWAEGEGSRGRAQAKKQKRQLHYVSNILVISDPKKPDTEGQVKLFKYGAKIHAKVMDAMQPAVGEDGLQIDPSEVAINPFDFWEGADFKLRCGEVEGWANYDKSEFAKPAPLFDDDKKIEEVYNKLYRIGEFIDPANYKSYDELKKHLNKVLGKTDEVAEHKEQEQLGKEEAEPEIKEKSAGTAEEMEASDEDAMKYFQELAD